MRIAIDMDEVLADTHAAKSVLYADLGYAWSDDELHGRKLGDVAPPDIAARVETEMQKGFFFAHVEPMTGAREAVDALLSQHEIFVATAAMEYPASCAHKVAWLDRHFPSLDPLRLVLCGDKSIVRADVLIDDSPRHFAGFGGAGICFTALHNRDADVPYRLDAWHEAEDLLFRLGRELNL